MVGLQVRSLVKCLGDHLAVDDLSFWVESGEFFVLLGSSGCGKTTTLRMICGLERPDSGTIVIGGRDVTSIPSRERNLGMVFQEYGLYPGMDVFGNLAYGLQARGHISKHEIERRVREAADKLSLTPLLRSPIADLSGGEQQRIALGRAMVKDAEAYLYDEPLSNLDPKLRHRMRNDILTIHRMKQKPSVYVTHDQTEAFAMADRVAVMARGRLHQVGTPDELIDAPETTFVAGFIGSPPMNLLRGQIGSDDGDYYVRLGEGTLALSPKWKSAVTEYGRQAIIVGVRPDRLVLRAEGEANTIAAEIVDVEPFIGETVVRLRTSDGASLSAVLDNDTIDGVTPGQRAWLAVKGEVCLFDAETEQALRS